MWKHSHDIFFYQACHTRDNNAEYSLGRKEERLVCLSAFKCLIRSVALLPRRAQHNLRFFFSVRHIIHCLLLQIYAYTPSSSSCLLYGSAFRLFVHNCKKKTGVVFVYVYIKKVYICTQMFIRQCIVLLLTSFNIRIIPLSDSHVNATLFLVMKTGFQSSTTKGLGLFLLNTKRQTL